MFGDVNRAEIIGNITNDIEVRYTPNGAAVASFGVATNRSYKQGDDWKDETNFHNVVAWANKAESLAKFAKKGTRVFISGRMQTRSWEDAESGKKMYKTEIVADEISLLARYEKSKGNGAGGNSNGEPMPEEPTDSKKGKGGDMEETINPEDLPF